MTRKLTQPTTDVNAPKGEEKPKPAARTLGFRATEAEYWAARERAAEKQLDLSDWLRALVAPALGLDDDRRKADRRAA